MLVLGQLKAKLCSLGFSLAIGWPWPRPWPWDCGLGLECSDTGLVNINVHTWTHAWTHAQTGKKHARHSRKRSLRTCYHYVDKTNGIDDTRGHVPVPRAYPIPGRWSWDLQKFSFFVRGEGTGWHHKSATVSLLSVLFNQCTILFGKCVRQLQIL